jgi:hypothetical protein
MDLHRYYEDLRTTEADLSKANRTNVVYVTSLFHRDRNSTEGQTHSASCRNAARVITDGTHRVATEAEIAAFLAHQQEELQRNTLSEQGKKQVLFVVADPTQGKGPAPKPAPAPAPAPVPVAATK